MISKEKIFDLFDNKEENLASDYDNFVDAPYIKIGMFNKILQNQEVFYQNLKYFNKKNNINTNEKDVYNYCKSIVFNRAFFWIEEININDTLHIDALSCYDSTVLKDNLKQTLEFFEQNEQYEKCAHLFKVITSLENLSK